MWLLPSKVQKSTKTSANWVTVDLNEVQKDDGNVAVHVRLWNDSSGQETHCKFPRSHLNSPVPITAAQIFPIAQCMHILYPKIHQPGSVDGVLCRVHGAWFHAEDAENQVGCESHSILVNQPVGMSVS